MSGVVMAKLEDQVRNQILQVSKMQLSLDSFREWFAPVAWNIEKSGNQSETNLVYQIEGILAEGSSGGWSDNDLREELVNAVVPGPVYAPLRRFEYGKSPGKAPSNSVTSIVLEAR